MPDQFHDLRKLDRKLAHEMSRIQRFIEKLRDNLREKQRGFIPIGGKTPTFDPRAENSIRQQIEEASGWLKDLDLERLEIGKALEIADKMRAIPKMGGDPKQLSLLHSAATAGNVEAQYHLGNALAKGLIGLAVNIPLAARFLTAADEHGSLSARQLLKQLGIARDLGYPLLRRRKLVNDLEELSVSDSQYSSIMGEITGAAAKKVAKMTNAFWSNS